MDTTNTKITLTLKSGTSQSQTVEVEENETVKNLRLQVSKIYDQQPKFVVLIFAGKILKDDHNLKEMKINNGHAVHVVLKKSKKKEETTEASSSQSQAATSGNNSSNQNTNTATPNTTPGSTTNPTSNQIPQATPPASGGLGNFGSMAGISADRLNSMQSEMMQNPELFSRLLDNPMITSLLSDPNVINEIFQTNPQMRAIMENNPEIASIMRDPNNLRQAMDMFRNPAAMQEMTRNHDRALRNLESMPGGFNHLARMHQDVIAPMEEAGAANNPFASLTGANNRTAATEGNNSANNANSNAENTNEPGAEGNNANRNSQNPFQIPGMSQGLQDAMRTHIASNPDLMRNLLTTQMGAEAANDPRIGTVASEMLGNPAVMAAMAKPEVQQAMVKIQEGMAVINTEAPELARAMGIPSTMGNLRNFGMPGMPASTMNANPSVPTRSPEDTYRVQLEQLNAMGFNNRQLNIRALQLNRGQVEAAVNWLFENSQ